MTHRYDSWCGIKKMNIMSPLDGIIRPPFVVKNTTVRVIRIEIFKLILTIFIVFAKMLTGG